MSHTHTKRHECPICGRTLRARELVPGSAVRDAVVQQIQLEHPDWTADEFICRDDLNRFRAAYVHSLLVSERGDLSALEQEVLLSLERHEFVARDVEEEFETEWTFGERLADGIAEFGGSWTFLVLFAGFLLVWVGVNTVVLTRRPVDPYPFILLNLVLSCLAAIQAPIIMMSQNRQEAKDRLRSQHDYQVNLKAELEIRHLHEKVDHLLSQQWERLAEIQEIQLELLSEIGRKR
ncbi:MAG: DUF1003 domain-containing protein [Gemmatimonadales bacterium]|jgi:uncharacterized membrane protein